MARKILNILKLKELVGNYATVYSIKPDNYCPTLYELKNDNSILDDTSILTFDKFIMEDGNLVDYVDNQLVCEDDVRIDESHLLSGYEYTITDMSYPAEVEYDVTSVTITYTTNKIAVFINGRKENQLSEQASKNVTLRENDTMDNLIYEGNIEYETAIEKYSIIQKPNPNSRAERYEISDISYPSSVAYDVTSATISYNGNFVKVFDDGTKEIISTTPITEDITFSENTSTSDTKTISGTCVWNDQSFNYIIFQAPKIEGGVVIYDSDYVLLSYDWETRGDVDTKTFITSEQKQYVSDAYNGYVGFNGNDTHVLGDSGEIQWGGDTTSPGAENVMFEINKLLESPSAINLIAQGYRKMCFDLKTIWYYSNSDGDEEYDNEHSKSGTIYVHTRAYSGGTMNHNGNYFINEGGVEIGRTETLDKYCSYYGGSSSTYLDFGYLYLDLYDGSVIVTTNFLPLDKVQTQVTYSNLTYPTNIDFNTEYVDIECDFLISNFNTVKHLKKSIYVGMNMSKNTKNINSSITIGNMVIPYNITQGTIEQSIDGISEPICVIYEDNSVHTYSSLSDFDGSAKTNGKYIILDDSVKELPTYSFYNFDKVEGVRVEGLEKIGDGNFYYMPELKTLTIPSTVTNIGSLMLNECNKLMELNLLASCEIPSQITSGRSSIEYITIGENTTLSSDGYNFYNNTNLVKITLPSNLTSIETNMFYGCKKLSIVEITSDLIEIKPGGFFQSGILTFDIPNTVTTIGSSAFGLCQNLSQLTIPSSVTSIHYDAISGCRNLKTIVYNASVIFSSDFTSSLLNDVGVEDLTISGITSSITNYELYYAKHLKKLTLGSNITEISSIILYDSKIKELYLCSLTPPKLGSDYNATGVFDKLETIYVHASAYDLYKYADGWKEPNIYAKIKPYFEVLNYKSLTITADNVRCRKTTTTVHCNYVTDIKTLDGAVINNYNILEDDISSEFSVNETNAPVTRTINYSNHGLSASTTIQQSAWEAPFYNVDIDVSTTYRKWYIQTSSYYQFENCDSYYAYASDGEFVPLKISFSGFKNFKIYIHASAEMNYDCVIAQKIDTDVATTSISPDDALVYASTSGMSDTSKTELSNYKEVVYENDGDDHFFYVLWRKDGSTSDGSDTGYLVVPRNQS